MREETQKELHTSFLTLNLNLVLDVGYLALNLNDRLRVKQICGNKESRSFTHALEKRNLLISHSSSLLWNIHKRSLLNAFGIWKNEERKVLNTIVLFSLMHSPCHLQVYKVMSSFLFMYIIYFDNIHFSVIFL